MYTAAQYRTAEQDYAGRGRLAESDTQRREYRALEGSFRTLADNQDWVDQNGDLLVAAAMQPRTCGAPEITYGARANDDSVSLLISPSGLRVVGPTKQIFGSAFSVSSSPDKSWTYSEALAFARRLAADLHTDVVIVGAPQNGGMEAFGAPASQVRADDGLS